MENINEPLTRKERRERRNRTETTEQPETPKKKTRKGRVRLIPIWLRIILVIVFMEIALMLGLMVGYGVIGDGNPIDALKSSTWTNIIDIIVEGTKE